MAPERIAGVDDARVGPWLRAWRALSRHRRTKSKYILGLVLLACVPLAPLLISEFHYRMEVAAAERAGDQVVDAIDRFHADHHFYPSDVNELLGQYLIDIPDPIIGGEQRRWTCSGGSLKFELGCWFQRDDLSGATRNYALEYDSEGRQWRVRELRS